MREEILTMLEKNGRIDLHDLAIMLGKEDIEVANEIHKMEEEKIICGYTAIINWDKVSDDSVVALIEVKVTPQRGIGFDAVAERIYNFEEVSSIYLMSGAYDFMVQIEGKSMKEVSRFVFEKLSTIESVQSTSTSFVLQKYKDHGLVLQDKKKDQRERISF